MLNVLFDVVSCCVCGRFLFCFCFVLFCLIVVVSVWMEERDRAAVVGTLTAGWVYNRQGTFHISVVKVLLKYMPSLAYQLQ